MEKNCKKNENVYKEKKAKNPQNLELFQKKALNFAIFRFSKVLKKKIVYKIKALLEVRFGKKCQKK